jgi:hypothetical protein
MTPVNMLPRPESGTVSKVVLVFVIRPPRQSFDVAQVSAAPSGDGSLVLLQRYV